MILYISLIFLYVNHFWTFKIVLKLRRDVEENSGPKLSSSQSFGHWNLNSISAYNCIKLLLLRTYVSTHKFDVICISASETYLNLDTSTV